MPALLNPLMMTLGVTHCIQDSVTNFTNRGGVMLLPLFFARQSRCLFFGAALKGLKALGSRGWTTSVKWLGIATRCTPNFTASSMMALVKWVLLPSTILAHANCTPFFSPKHLDFVSEKNSFFCHLENTVF